MSYLYNTTVDLCFYARGAFPHKLVNNIPKHVWLIDCAHIILKLNPRSSILVGDVPRFTSFSFLSTTQYFWWFGFWVSGNVDTKYLFIANKFINSLGSSFIVRDVKHLLVSHFFNNIYLLIYNFLYTRSIGRIFSVGSLYSSVVFYETIHLYFE